MLFIQLSRRRKMFFGFLPVVRFCCSGKQTTGKNQQNKIIIGKLLFKNKYFTGSGCLFLILWCNIIYIVDVDVMLTVLYLFMFCYEIQMCYYVISYRNGFHCAVSFDSSLYPDSWATFCCRVLGFRTKIIKPFMVKVRCLFGSLSVTVNYYFLVWIITLPAPNNK